MVAARLVCVFVRRILVDRSPLGARGDRFQRTSCERKRPPEPNLSRATLWRLERGDPSVALGTLATCGRPGECPAAGALGCAASRADAVHGETDTAADLRFLLGEGAMAKRLRIDAKTLAPLCHCLRACAHRGSCAADINLKNAVETRSPRSAEEKTQPRYAPDLHLASEALRDSNLALVPPPPRTPRFNRGI